MRSVVTSRAGAGATRPSRLAHLRLEFASPSTHVGRCGQRGQLLIVAAKGKGKRGSQGSVLLEEPLVEEAAPLPALNFVIEEEPYEDEDEWVDSKPSKKGAKGKGKKQKGKKAAAAAVEPEWDAVPAVAVEEPSVPSMQSTAWTEQGEMEGSMSNRGTQGWESQDAADPALTPASASPPARPGRSSPPAESSSSPGAVASAAEFEQGLDGPRTPQGYNTPQVFAAPSRDYALDASGYSTRDYGSRDGGGFRSQAAGSSRGARQQEWGGYRDSARGAGEGWYDPEKRKAWNEKRSRVFSRVTTREIQAAGTWEEVADILQARDRILDHIHITAALTVVSKVTDLSRLEEGEQERFEELLAVIYRKLYTGVERLGPRELATNLLSLARLGYTSDEVVQALLAACPPRMAEFNAIELCNTIYALGQMSVVPSPEWMDSFFRNSTARMQQFKPLELANTIHSLGKLQQQPPPAWLDAFFAHTASLLDAFTARDGATLLFGLGLLGAAPSEGWLDRYLEASMRGMRGARVTDLKRSVWALSQFDHAPQFKWQNQFAGRCKALLDYFSAEDLLTSVLAMAYLRFSLVDADLLGRLVAKLRERRGRFQGEDIANLNNALRALGHRGAALEAPAAAAAAAVAKPAPAMAAAR